MPSVRDVIDRARSGLGRRQEATRRPRTCPECGEQRVYRSRPRTALERLLLAITPLRVYRCHECDRRGWRLFRPAGDDAPAHERDVKPRRSWRPAVTAAAQRARNAWNDAGVRRTLRLVGVAVLLALGAGVPAWGLYTQRQAIQREAAHAASRVSSWWARERKAISTAVHAPAPVAKPAPPPNVPEARPGARADAKHTSTGKHVRDRSHRPAAREARVHERLQPRPAVASAALVPAPQSVRPEASASQPVAPKCGPGCGRHAWGPTCWGMSVEEVLAATGGAAIRIDSGARATGENRVPAAVLRDFEMGGHRYAVSFRFDANAGLGAVELSPVIQRGAPESLYRQLTASVSVQEGQPLTHEETAVPAGSWNALTVWTTGEKRVELRGWRGAAWHDSHVLLLDLRSGDIQPASGGSVLLVYRPRGG